MAVFVLAMLTGIGVTLLALSRQETRMSRASLRAKQAFYIAEAGIESARLTLYASNRNGPFTDDLLAAAGPNGVLEIDPEAIRPVYDSNGGLTGFTGVGDDLPLAPLTALGDGWYTAFLTNDPAEPDPFQFNTSDTNQRLMITGVAGGADGSFEVAQAIVEMRQIIPALPPAAITLLGPDPHFDGGTSSAKKYVGDDCDGAGEPGLFVPTIGVIGPGAAADPCPATNDSVICGVHKPSTYNSGPHQGGGTVADVTDPSVFGGVGPIHPDWNDCQFLHNLVGEVRAAADVICPAGSLGDCPDLPPSSPSRVIFVDGDLVVDPTDSGDGLLLVTGELTLLGQTDWSGLLLVVGVGSFIRSGAGNGSVSGASFVANISGPDGAFGTGDDCSGGPGGFMQASFDNSGGGTGDDVFCTASLFPSFPVRPYPVVEFRQH
jgi:hypothetical protein